MSTTRTASPSWLRSSLDRAQLVLNKISTWHVFAIALSLRLVVVALRSGDWGRTENLSAGFTLAVRGYLGDPYPFPTGPTAHVAPAYPALIAVARLICPDESTAVLLLQVLAAVTSAANVALLIPLATSLRFGRSAGVICALFWLIPTFTWIELSAEFETVFLVSGTLLLLLLTIKRFEARRLNPFDGGLIGASAGIVAHLSPNVLPMLAFSCLAGVMSIGLPVRKATALAVSVLAMFFVVVTPYTIRNFQTFDSVFLIRSNFGLELALSNADGAKPIAAANNAKGGTLSTHPFNSEVEATRLRQLGEVRYFRERQSAAMKWISGHPTEFLKLSAARAYYLLVPYSVRWWQRVLATAVTVLAIASVAFLWRTEYRIPIRMLAAASLGMEAIYLIIQSDIRYVYPSLWINSLLAAALVLCVRRSDAYPPPTPES